MPRVPVTPAQVPDAVPALCGSRFCLKSMLCSLRAAVAERWQEKGSLSALFLSAGPRRLSKAGSLFCRRAPRIDVTRERRQRPARPSIHANARVLSARVPLRHAATRSDGVLGCTRFACI